MTQNESESLLPRKFAVTIEKELKNWHASNCPGVPDMWRSFDYRKKPLRNPRHNLLSFESNWAESIPGLISSLAVDVKEKKKQELPLAVIQTIIQFSFDRLDRRINRLEARQTIVVPIDSFVPEPYKVLKTIFVTVNSVEGGFNAGWFDANIHFSGDNEQEAVSNLKGLILDVFEAFSSETPENLGPEPTRQLAVIREYIQKKP